MKRTFLALVCVLALFASCNKEKPNEKFVGNYKAESMELKATLESSDQTVQSLVNGQEIPVNFDDVLLSITAGNKKDEVTAVMTVEGDNYTFKGTCSGDVIDFEQTTLVIEKDEIIQGFNFSLSAVVDASAKLNSDGQLLYSATFTGSGNASAVIGGISMSAPLTMKNGKIEMTIFLPQAN